ncbi:uncharacterized protein [Anabrus simplex]|uniref:uncharacterized protein n=1 Tax=Anabrus simplex TaxID=316456 RepID=UPI0035A26685
MALSSVLSVGMYVSIKVQKYEDNGFSFKATCVEVNEDMNYIHNINKVSASKHIECGLGTVVEIVSATIAQLEFELDGQHLGMFKLSDFFVNGKKCDDSKELAVYISKGDVYFFDAIKRNKDNADYSITCVWQGQKPELLTLLEPYKFLVQDYKEIPDSIFGNVIAIISSRVAIVETNIYNIILLTIDSLKEEIQQITEEGWIQDYLNIGDMVSLRLCTKSKFFGFPLAKSVRILKGGSIVKNGPVPQKESVSSHPMVNQPQSPEISQCSSLSLESNENSNEIHYEVRNLPRCEINDQVLQGIITYLASYSGTVEVEVGKQKQVVAFTKNEVHINKERLSSSLPLSAILQVGMTVSLIIDPCLEGGDLSLKATLVDVNVPSPNFDSNFFYGSIEKFRGTSGIILFYLDDKVERATFLGENIFYNSSKPQPVTSFLMMMVEVGMRVSVKVMRCTDITDYNYKALVVQIEDSHLAAYGFGTSLNPIQSVQIFSGIINSLWEEYGTIEFKMNNKNHKAVFTKKDVHLNQNVIPSTVSLLKVLKLDQAVFFRLEMFENIFQATFVEVSSESLTISQYISDAKEQLADGNERCGSLSFQSVDNENIKEWEGEITGFLSTSVGIIECCIDGEIYEGFFNRDMIICDNYLETNLPKLFKLGERVLFKGKLKPSMHMTRLEIICVWQPQNSEKSQKENFKANFSEGIKSSSDLSVSSSDEEETYTSLSLETASDLEITELEGKITGYLSSSLGIIKCCFNGKEYEARFTKDIIFGNEVNDEIQKILPLGKVVKCDGKIEPFKGKENLRILSIWEHQTSQKSRRKLWNFADSLRNGQEHTGTVFEILKGNSFIVAIKNVPVLVNKKYFSKLAKFPSYLNSVQFGDSITIIIEKKSCKNFAYDWVAVDAWRTKDVFYGPILPKIGKSCSVDDLVLEGELLFIANDHGVLIDDYNQVTFQSADAFLFGVSVEDVDLTQIFKPGDKFSYSLCLDSQYSKVWYGTQEFKDSSHQLQEISNFCRSRSIDGALLSTLMTRLGNEENVCKEYPLDFSTEGLPKTCQEQVLDISKSINQNHDQKLFIEKKGPKPAFDLSKLSVCRSLMPNFVQQLCDLSESEKRSPDKQPSSLQVDRKLKHLSIEEVENINLKPICDSEALDTIRSLKLGVDQEILNSEEILERVTSQQFSAEGITEAPEEQCLGLDENQKITDDQQVPYITNELPLASHAESLDTQQFLLEARNQFTALRRQLTHSACPVLTDGVKQIVLEYLSHNDSYNEVHDKAFALIESGIKDCISGHLLTEAIECLLDETNPSSHNMELDLASDCFSSTPEKGQSEVCTSKDISVEISKKLDDSRLVKEVVYIDREAQTMSTGPVFYTCVFPE